MFCAFWVGALLVNARFPSFLKRYPVLFLQLLTCNPQDEFLYQLHSSSSFNRMVSHVKHSSKFDVWLRSHVGHVLNLYVDWDIVPMDCHSYSPVWLIKLHPLVNSQWIPRTTGVAHHFFYYARIETGLPPNTRSSRLFIYNKFANAPLRVR